MTETAGNVIDRTPVVETVRPTHEYSFDPSILRRLQVGEDHIDLRGNNARIYNAESAIYGVVDEKLYGQSQNPESPEGPMGTTAGLIREVLSESITRDFDPLDPIRSMREAFFTTQERVQTAKFEGQIGHDVLASTSVARFYHEGTTLKAVYGHVGDGRILVRSGDEVKEITRDEGDVEQLHHGFGHEFFDPVQVGVIDLKPGDRLVFLSADMIGDTRAQYMTEKEFNDAMSWKDPQVASELFIDYSKKKEVDKSVIVVDVPRRRRRLLGRVGLGGATTAGYVRSTNYVSERVASRRLARAERGERRRGSVFGRVALLGLGLVGVYLAYQGLEHTIFDFGDGKDKGIDLWPGRHDGLDLNAWNGSSTLNDDPVQPLKHLHNKKGFDILPPLLDGDWFSLRPDHSAKHAAVAAKIPDLLTGPPVFAHPSSPPNVTVPSVPAWQPTPFVAEPGTGYIREFRELGNQIVGPNYSAHQAERAFDATRAAFGNDLIDLPHHAGPDSYLVGNDLRISAPDPTAHWRTQMIEAFARQSIEDSAKQAA
ncbi:MAG: hypothetical protein JWM81_284 [Candidatus Saccharibacteria bacterium]|nr:hypothetical protein [Candidatus Saccharibacteria bacterium]